jgi:hypothetical protein
MRQALSRTPWWCGTHAACMHREMDIKATFSVVLTLHTEHRVGLLITVCHAHVRAMTDRAHDEGRLKECRWCIHQPLRVSGRCQHAWAMWPSHLANNYSIGTCQALLRRQCLLPCQTSAPAWTARSAINAASCALATRSCQTGATMLWLDAHSHVCFRAPRLRCLVLQRVSSCSAILTTALWT